MSNFYGGVEENFAAMRFPVLKPLLDEIQTIEKEEFVDMLKDLQPSKQWNKKKENFWFDPKGEPIRGILAKLIMNSFETGKGNK